MKIIALFGTRPEIIKLAPVIQRLGKYKEVQLINVASGQHVDLLYPFLRLFGISIDEDLQIMDIHQSPAQVSERVFHRFLPVLNRVRPDLLLVQGDTSTAVGGALAGFARRIPIAHVEAGLRSGTLKSPFPEEFNRRLITRLASYHFAPTAANRANLIFEGIPAERIFVTGNPVVDSLQSMLQRPSNPPLVQALLEKTQGLKRILFTSHRRENFASLIPDAFKVLRTFIGGHSDKAIIFPVHPNPCLAPLVFTRLSGHPRILLIRPLNYDELVALLKHAWLVISDSGGLQEEAATLGKPLLILRENTERPEVLQSGMAWIVGSNAKTFERALEKHSSDPFPRGHGIKLKDIFGKGDSAARISEIICSSLHV